MRFEDVLAEHPAPKRVGDVHFSYDPPVLMGQTLAPRGPVRLLPELLWVGALAGGVGTVAALVFRPGGSVVLPVALAAGAALILLGASRAEAWVRRPRRFALHFGEETLRLEDPGALGRRARHCTVGFDEVLDVFVVEREDGTYSLLIALRQEENPQGFEAVLVDRVTAEEGEALRRLWTALRAAFGISRAEP